MNVCYSKIVFELMNGFDEMIKSWNNYRNQIIDSNVLLIGNVFNTDGLRTIPSSSEIFCNSVLK